MFSMLTKMRGLPKNLMFNLSKKFCCIRAIELLAKLKMKSNLLKKFRCIRTIDLLTKLKMKSNSLKSFAPSSR